MTTDELLVFRAKNGDLKAYEILIERYQHKVYNLTAKMVKNEEDAPTESIPDCNCTPTLSTVEL